MNIAIVGSGILRLLPEDGRYRRLRRQWGSRASRNFFWLLLVASRSTPAFGWMDVAGTGVWLAAVAGERAADRQLARFREASGNRGTGGAR